MRYSIIELLGLTSVVGLVAYSWRTGQDRGILITIIALVCIAYYVNRLRSQSPFLPTTLMALPIIAIGIFVFSFAFGLRHPPFMVPSDWKWPPFESFGERMVHAFAFSIWTFIFGTPTILVLGIVRRLHGASPEAPETATNNPMNPSGGSGVS